MKLKKKPRLQRRSVIRTKFPSTQEVMDTLKKLGYPVPVIVVFVDERLPEGAKVQRLLQQSGLPYRSAPTSGAVEIKVDGFRYVGLNDIKQIIRRIKTPLKIK